MCNSVSLQTEIRSDTVPTFIQLSGVFVVLNCINLLQVPIYKTTLSELKTLWRTVNFV